MSKAKKIAVGILVGVFGFFVISYIQYISYNGLAEYQKDLEPFSGSLEHFTVSRSDGINTIFKIHIME